MSAFAKALSEAKAPKIGAVGKIALLDAEDRAMIAQKRQEGLSYQTIAAELTKAGFPITAVPIQRLLREMGVD